MSEYRLLEPAAVELADAVAFYEGYTSRLGTAFLEEFDRAMELITSMPEAWSQVDHEVRRFLLRRFPYSIFYSVEDELVIVLTVFHQHRNPNSWRKNSYSPK